MRGNRNGGGGGRGGRGGSRSGSRGGGGGRGGARGRGGRGGHGVRGGAVRKPTGEYDRFKKFKHIQRNQEAEEQLRQRKGLELQHTQLQQRQQRLRDADMVSSSDEEEPNAMDQLLLSLQATAGKLKSKKKSAAIESSDSDVSDMDGDESGEEDVEEEEDVDEDPELDAEVDSELDDEEIAEEEEVEEDDDDDDDDDFQINEQFEQQSERKPPATPKPRVKTEVIDEDDDDDDDDAAETDSSDEDEDQVLRPEEGAKQKRSDALGSRSKLDYVIHDSGDESEDEQELNADIEIAEQLLEAGATSAADTFSAHLDHEISPALLECVNTTHTSAKHELHWPRLGRLQLEIPNAALDASATGAGKRRKTAAAAPLLLDADTTYATEGTVPERYAHRTATVEQLALKSQMHPHVAAANAVHLAASADSRTLTGVQAELFSVMANYQDLYYPGRTHDNGEEIRFAYCLHALNHILKTRTKILHHNAKLGRMADAASAATAAGTHARPPAPTIIPDAYRDQGLFRPKVLIVVPFRESARRVVNALIALVFPERGEKVMHYARFEEEFGGEALHFPQRNPKPEDYERTFAGNSDDTFRLGVCLTRKCMKLYADFYSSDILIVSPLGLRMVVGAAGEKDRDYDFLASIELLVLDQAELFVAQNWDHLLHVMDHLHLQPQSARNTDFSRVRSWCLNGWARFYRQTLLFASHELPEFRALFNGRCANYRGRVRVANPVLSGSIRHVAVPVAQVFHRVDVASIQTSFDQRFQHFVTHVLPQFKAATMAHCAILVPSYFDFVRLRNYFKKESLNFVQICEYTKDSKMARSRDMFFHSGAHFLLYSERAHFFRRTRVKGIRHLIMYAPPTWPHFYAEMVNLMQEAYQNPRDGAAGTQTVTVLYTKYDMLQVAAVVGSERAAKMATSEKATHMFMTGE